MNFNELIKVISENSDKSAILSYYNDRVFAGATIDKTTGAVTYNEEHNYGSNVGDINEKLKASKEALNLNPTGDLPAGAEYIYAFMGWKKEVQLTA